MSSAGEVLRQRAVAGRQTRDLRGDEFASRESGILRYLVGWRFWEDSRRKVIMTVVGVASASDVWVKLPGGRYRSLRAGYVREAIDARGVDAAGSDLDGPVDWSEAVRTSRHLSWGKDPLLPIRSMAQPVNGVKDASVTLTAVPPRVAPQPKLVVGRTQPEIEGTRRRLGWAGDVLRVLRKRQGFSQGALALAAETSQTKICELEAGRCSPSDALRKRLASAMEEEWGQVWPNDLMSPTRKSTVEIGAAEETTDQRARTARPIQDREDAKVDVGQLEPLRAAIDAPAETPTPVTTRAQRLREAGNCLWMYRERKGKGQRTLAEAIGESRGLVAALENGLAQPTRDQRRKIAETLGLAEDAIWSDDLLKPGASVSERERSEARSFGLGFRLRRMTAERTQVEIAERAGIPAWRLGQIEMGIGLLTDKEMRQRLLKALEKGL